jgi:WD repeat-containing protein 26
LHDLPDHNNGVCYVAWSPDDTKIITCTQAQDASARLWDTHTGKLILTLSQLTYSVTSAAWAPNGETFVIGSHDVEDPLCVWSIDNKRVYQWKEDSLRVHDLSISPDGQRLVVLLENRVLVYDFVSREKIAEWAIDGVKTTSINISADSKHMLVSMNENSIRLMVIDTGEVLQSFEGHRQTEFVVRSAFGGANENFVVSGSEGMIYPTNSDFDLQKLTTLDSRIYIWRTNGAPVEVLDAHPPGCVNAVAWHPRNPSVFASAGDDHKVRM